MTNLDRDVRRASLAAVASLAIAFRDAASGAGEGRGRGHRQQERAAGTRRDRPVRGPRPVAALTDSMGYFQFDAVARGTQIMNPNACSTNEEGVKTCGEAGGFTSRNPSRVSRTGAYVATSRSRRSTSSTFGSTLSTATRTIDWLPDGNNAEGLLLNVFRGGSDYTNDEDGKTLTMGVQNLNDVMTGSSVGNV